MDFRQHISYIAERFPAARAEKFGKHELADVIRNTWHLSATAMVPALIAEGLKFQGSAGRGNWSDAPWLAVLSPAVTDSARAGFYPAYLFEPGLSSVCLVMVQGAESLTVALGSKAALPILRERALALRNASKKWKSAGFVVDDFQTVMAVVGRIPEARNDPWAVSVAFGKRYRVAALPSNDEMGRDLARMLLIYKQIALVKSLSFGEQDRELEELKNDGEAPTIAGLEGQLDGMKRVVEHHKVERRVRNQRLIKQVRGGHPAVCSACDFSFGKRYGNYMEGFVEVHHKVPLSQLPSDGAVLKPTAEDFMILCSNCHRAIHRAGCPDLETFKRDYFPNTN